MAPEKSSTSPARNVKMASTRGANCSVRLTECRVDARCGGSVLSHRIGTEHDERDDQRHQVINGAVHNQGGEQLR